MPESVHYRVQVAGITATDAASALRIVAELIDAGTTSGYLEQTYNFEPVSMTTPVQPLHDQAPVAVLTEIEESSLERVAFTVNLIAEQVERGLLSGADSHDEGSWFFQVTQR